MASISWYLARLRRMSAGEIAYRVRSAVAVQGLRLRQPGRGERWWRAWDAADFAFCTSADHQLPELPFAVPDDGAMGRWARGDVFALGHLWRWGGDDASWRRAPDTGRLWPDRFFGDIPHREGNPYGDIRVMWEPARLQWLLPLAAGLAEGAGSDPGEAGALIERVVTSWARGNPPYRGPHYVSAMECALRLIALAHTLDRVRGSLGSASEVWSIFVAVVVSHARLIERRLSLYSSAGNHTVAEAVGLLHAGWLLPELREAHRWRRRGLELLVDQAERQILPDGGSVEQAFWYQLFVVDLYGLAAELLRAKGQDVPPGIAGLLDRGRSFLGEVADSPEQIPAIGDADDGFALSPHLRLSFQARPERTPGRTLPDSGYTVRRVGPGEVIFDHGPLGMPPSCGHGHTDALSLVLRVSREEALADPGTFSYTGHPDWRGYFRSTRVHNTVEVDGRDQAEQVGPFLWSGYFQGWLVDSGEDETGWWLLAEHDGYRRLGVHHLRGVAGLGEAGLIVWDRIAEDADGDQGRHSTRLNWNLAGTPEETESGADLEVDGLPITIRVRDPVGEGKMTVGTEQGWRSRRYGQREPITCLVASRQGPLPHEYLTLVTWKAVDPPGSDTVQARVEALRQAALENPG